MMGCRRIRSAYPRWCSLCLVTALLFAAAAASPVGGQTIAGTLVEAGTQRPVEGAQIILLDSLGNAVGWRLTDGSGRFRFDQDRPGTFYLRADRIGLESLLSEPIEVRAGDEINQLMEASVQAIALRSIHVESHRRCEIRPDALQDGSIASVWEEARKALEAASQTNRRQLNGYVLRRYERELDASGRNVRSEVIRESDSVLRQPFAAVGVEEVLERGFVHTQSDGGTTYFAPDADLMLSDAFLDTHCMSLIEGEGESEGYLGLAFEPIEDRGVVEISGVLWVDREDGELRWLDYRYEFLAVPGEERLGGRVRFRGLSDGTWIVDEWSVRMPIIQYTLRTGFRNPVPRLAGLKEEGGVVVRVERLEDRTEPLPGMPIGPEASLGSIPSDTARQPGGDP